MRAIVAVGLVLLVACGDNLEPAPGDIAPRVAITVPPRGLPGQPVVVGWEVEGSHALVIVARAPGAAPLPMAGRFLQPGFPIASGDRYYLAPDGSWDGPEVVFASQARSGQTTITLPTTASGDWQFSAELRDASARVIAMANATIAISDEPTLQLRVGRHLARPDEPLTATLVTGAGAAPQPVRIVAWLVAPDGTQRPLPLGATSGLIHDGTLWDGEIPLFATPLAVGEHRIEARMYDASGALLASAGAGLAVCDVVTPVTGTVFDADGRPFGAVPSAELVAFDIDRGDLQTLQLAADGTYSLALPPGRFGLRATVFDGELGHSAIAEDLVVTGCAGTPRQIDLHATPGGPLPVTARSMARTVPPRPAGDACLGKPATMMVIFLNGRRTEDGTINAIEGADILESRIGALFFHALKPNISVSTGSTLRGLLLQLARKQVLGVDEAGAIPLLQNAAAADALAIISLERGAGHLFVRGSIVDRRTTRTLVGAGAQHPDSADPIAVTDAVVNELVAADLPALICGARPRPQHPELVITATPERPRIGEPVRIVATVREAGGDPASDVPVTWRYIPPESIYAAPTAQRTDAAGQIVFDGVAGSRGGIGRFHVELADRTCATCSAEKHVPVDDPDDLGLSAARVSIAPGEGEIVRVHFTRGGLPVPNAQVYATAEGGSVTPSTTTDANGDAQLGFRAGATEGAGRIIVRDTAALASKAPIESELYFQIEAPARLRLAADPSFVFAGGTAALRADLDVLVGDPAGVPITFTLDGSGAITTPTVTTGPGGLAETIYEPPASGGGTCEVTASTSIDGRPFTATTTMSYGDIPTGSFSTVMRDVTRVYLAVDANYSQSIGTAQAPPVTATISAAGGRSTLSITQPVPYQLIVAVDAYAPPEPSRPEAGAMGDGDITLATAGTLRVEYNTSWAPRMNAAFGLDNMVFSYSPNTLPYQDFPVTAGVHTFHFDCLVEDDTTSEGICFVITLLP